LILQSLYCTKVLGFRSPSNIYEGYLKIPKDGIYSISISSNDRNDFFLDGKQFGGGSIAIRKGIYKILQKYDQEGNKKWYIVSWEGPGIKKQEIPASAYFHENELGHKIEIEK